jgi:serine phosphatase RsbU (regulator of sigma subunit)
MHYRAAADRFDWRAATSVPLGFLPAGDLKEPASIEMAPGDILGLITDGVFESEDASSVLFGETGVEEVIRAHAGRPLREIADLLLAEVDDYVGSAPQADDITIVLLRRTA